MCMSTHLWYGWSGMVLVVGVDLVMVKGVFLFYLFGFWGGAGQYHWQNTYHKKFNITFVQENSCLKRKLLADFQRGLVLVHGRWMVQCVSKQEGELFGGLEHRLCHLQFVDLCVKLPSPLLLFPLSGQQPRCPLLHFHELEVTCVKFGGSTASDVHSSVFLTSLPLLGTNFQSFFFCCIWNQH